MALSTLILLAPALPADASEGCVPVARIVSIQGAVQIQRSGQTAWTVVRKLDTVVCQGDVLHAGPRSRAALLIAPETLVRLDQSSTLSIRQTPDETIVEFTKDPGLFQRVVTAPNPCGAGYFISRFPRKFRVLTPFVNASVEGTEFLVAMRCESALVAVFEGRVRAEEVLAAATFSLKEGESVEAGVGQPAAMKLVVKPVDAVQWALYYPPLTEAVGEAAADQKCDQADNAARSVCLVQRAEQRLRSGRVEEAEADVQTLLALGLGDGDAYALLSILQVVRNDKTAALDLANRATQLSPSSPRAWIALSYAHQAAFDLEKALAAAKKAAELAPGATAQARVAELLMSLGRIRDAEKAAKAAVAANPNDSRAHMVLGFVHLAQINTQAAREDFLNAIERDSTEPLARLGLGLAIIRDGNLKAGREQIEIAVALDPTNSLLRSYVGKAYYEENTKERDKLAATQFGIAKRLDPKDPTPWYYDAILKQTQNRPVDALEELQQSIQLNDNRAVYRSNLLLDQDLAVRSTSAARTYEDLGFYPLAQLEAYKSLAEDSGNYSAHRFLADAFLARPRHEIARVSELLQAQLLQPISAIPIQPQLSAGTLGIIDHAGPADASFNEYTQLFSRNRFAFLGSVLVGNHDTFADDLVGFGQRGPLSVSVGQYHYETDGFRPNNDQEQDVYGAFLQYALTPATSLQLEFRENERDSGDIELKFDAVNPDNPSNFSLNTRSHAENRVVRLGGLHAFSPGSKVIASYSDQRLEAESLTDLAPGSFELRNETDGNLLEVAHLFDAPGWGVTTGFGRFRSEVIQSTTVFDPSLPPFIPQPIFSQTKPNVDHSNLYSYARITSITNVAITLGLSADFLDREGFEERDQINPKLGVIWTPQRNFTVRAAAFRTMKRDLVANQTVEPTQVAGFNQFFDDLNGTDARRYAGGVDWRLSSRLYVGAEASKRDLKIPGMVVDGLTGTSREITAEWDEEQAQLYLFAVPARSVVLSMQYIFERFERPDDFTAGGFTDLDTHRVPITVSLFHPIGLSAQLRFTYVDQSGRFIDPSSFTPQFVLGSDSFAVVDAELQYRLPRRHGFLSIGAHNLLDEHFNYQDTDPVHPRFQPERSVFGRVVLLF